MLDDNESQKPCSDFEQDKQIAEISLISKNLLLNPVFVTYYMGWKHLINPQSRDLSVLYNGMGPDASTILLATNATSITSIDPKHPTLKELSEYLGKWDIIDTDLYTLPGNINVMDDEVRNDPTETKLNTYLQGILKNKAISGHWDSLDISALGVSRALLIELKKLGVDNKSIKITGEGDKPTIEFLWAYPGEQPKTRVIKFGVNFLESFIDDQVTNSKNYDGFYEKSIMAGSVTQQPDVIKKLIPIINSGGFFLVGSGRGSEIDNFFKVDNNLKPLQVSNNYDANVLKSYPRLANGYTYRLNGCTKTL